MTWLNFFFYMILQKLFHFFLNLKTKRRSYSQYSVKILFLAAIIFCLPIADGWTQEIQSLKPGAIQKRSKETMEYYKLQKKLKEKKLHAKVIKKPA